MKVLKRFVVVAITLAFFLTVPGLVAAYTCESLTVTPTTGTPSTAFVLEATGCAAEPGDTTGYFDVLPTRPGDDTLTPYPAQLLAQTQVFSQLGGFTQSGNYTLTLRYREGATYIKNIGSVTITIQDGSDVPIEEEEEIPVLTCGVPCDPATTCNLCPAFCPAERDIVTGFWQCGRGPLCQNTTYNAAGIDSAIGCIPFDDANKTTVFFLSWALGVGGGIALFLISISAIKIMTTRGDHKRLQDARDTLSSAIAGLVMIILSVFIIRFVTETLLGLF